VGGRSGDGAGGGDAFGRREHFFQWLVPNDKDNQ
jgi:hypothetical protein